MAITFSNLGTSTNPDINTGIDASSYVNTSWTPPTSEMCCVFVMTDPGASGSSVATISGNGITWTSIKTLTQLVTGTTYRLTLFAAPLSGATTGATTIDFAGNVQSGCLASFFQVTGADLTGGVAAAFVQSPTNSGTTGTTGTVTLAAAADPANRPISAFFHIANEGTTPRASWTELDDLANSGPVRGMDTQYRGDAFETTASATWTTSAGWLGIAAELKTPGGAVGSDVNDPFGMRGFFGG